MDLVVGEDKVELDFILKKIKKKKLTLKVLPLSLDTLIYCKNYNLNFFNPQNYINNQFHKNILISSNKLIKILNFGKIEIETQKKEFKNFIRKKYFQIYYTYFLISSILKKNKIENIYVSGWSYNFDKISNVKKNYSITEILKEYFPNKIKLAQSKISSNSSFIENYYSFSLSKFNNNKKKAILFTSQGYNIFRFIFIAKLLNYCIYIVSEKRKSNFINKILKLIDINFLYFKKKNNVKLINSEIKDIKFYHSGINFSNLLNKSINDFNSKLTNIYYKSEAIKEFLRSKKIDLVVSTMARGYQGSAIDHSKILKIKTLGISHGTISKAFNIYDKIYKQIIAEGVYSKNYDYFTLQSDIASKSIHNLNVTSKNLKTGNLIFAQSYFNLRKKNKILYAVTNKNYNQMQFLGVDLYFEFYKNLEMLNELSKKEKYEIIVNLHPSVDRYSFKNLKKIFKNLEITQGNISKYLKKTFVTISYSSTVIEDSIHFNVPVILFDSWKRYKHCDSETNIKNKNQPIYYVSDIENLSKCINSIKKNYQTNFDTLKYGGNCFKNIYRLLKQI